MSAGIQEILKIKLQSHFAPLPQSQSKGCRTTVIMWHSAEICIKEGFNFLHFSFEVHIRKIDCCILQTKKVWLQSLS